MRDYHFNYIMQKLFTKILVPVNFNRNTGWSVEKTIQLANKFECDVLLLHVQPPPSTIPFLYNAFFSGSLIGSTEDELKTRMKELESKYKPKLREGLFITSAVMIGYWQQVLKDMIVTEHIDLVLIPRSHRHLNNAVIRRININKLSQQTNCPIMTINRSFNAGHLQNIVVPVFDLLPVKKLTMATYLSLETRGCIYLMGKNESSKPGNGYLMKAYQLLNEFGKVNIQFAVQDGEDMASGTLSYAKGIKANLIVINPGKESRLRGWWNKVSGNYLSKESDIPVLTVST